MFYSLIIYPRWQNTWGETAHRGVHGFCSEKRIWWGASQPAEGDQVPLKGVDQLDSYMFSFRRRGKNLVAAHNSRQRKLSEVEVRTIWVYLSSSENFSVRSDIIWDHLRPNIWDHLRPKMWDHPRPTIYWENHRPPQELTMRVRKARVQNERSLRRHQHLLKEKVDIVIIYILEVYAPVAPCIRIGVQEDNFVFDHFLQFSQCKNVQLG